MRHCSIVTVIGLSLVCVVPAPAAEWEPAKGLLMTKWAKDVSPENVHAEYPRPQLVRKDWQNLNGVWEFAVAKDGEEPPLGREFDGRILVPFPVESALSGVMKPAKSVWYRRMFDVNNDWADQRLLLHFGAVNWEATVWINGKKIDSHQGGYDAFTLDITEAVKKEGPQEIVVGVSNPIDGGTQPRGKQVCKPGGIFYTASTGIWQTVWLEPVPKVYIQSLKVVPSLDDDSIEILVRVPGAGGKHNLLLKSDDKNRGWIVPDVQANKPEKIKIDTPHAWSPEDPYLHPLEVRLYDGKTLLDQVTSYFAMRKVEIKKDDKGVNRIHLNDKPYFQVGLLDQGFWPDGLYTAPSDDALKYDLELTKKLGFYMIRKHVKVEPERWYYWCDKLGLVVWQDMPSGDASVQPGKGEIRRTEASAKQYQLELSRMIEGRGNHPCIIMWVPFNEGWGQFDTKRIVDLVKKQDPSRLADPASGWNDFPCGDVLDVHVYPGPGAPEPVEKRAIVLGEFGGLGLGIDGHTWDKKTWGYKGAADSADLTRKYEQLLRKVYELKDKPGLSAVVYTQTTDVETECNGLVTYDRALVKVDVDRVQAANKGDFSRIPTVKVLVPTSKEEGQTWQYTITKPAEGWHKVDFDDKAWKVGKGGFGTEGTPGAVVGTEWKTDDIWLRREFTMPDRELDELVLLVHHDEDLEVYINGVLAMKAPGYITDYEEFSISDEARKALKPGKNVFAVHCHQTVGGQYIDVGLGELKAAKK